jgi:hypothetical protein
MPHPDDLAALKAERDAADRAYNEALTRLDRAIQRLPSAPAQPPPPDDHQLAPLNTLWKIDVPPVSGLRGRWIGRAVRRLVAPLFEQQQAFNSAVVDHLNRNAPVARAARDSAAATAALAHDALADLVRFESLLIMFLQQITPYVDTRDRDVAGLLRGLSGAINAVADELMKRADAMLARDRRHDARVAELEAQVAAVRARLDEMARALPSREAGHVDHA